MHLLTALLLALASPPPSTCVSASNAGATPSHASPLVLRGLEHLRDGQHTPALAELNKAIEIDPSLALAYFARGQAYGSLGLFDFAISDYDRVVALNPNFAAAYASKGRACQASGRFVDALKAYRTFLALASLESCHDEIELVKRGLDQLTSADTCKAYLVRGTVALGRGKNSEAIATFDEGIELIPKCWILYDYRGMAHKYAGEYESALADYDRSIALNPKYIMPYMHRAWTYEAAGRVTDALAAYRQFIDVADPKTQAAVIEQARQSIAKLEGKKK